MAMMAGRAPGGTPPNVLLLVTDDQGAWALGSRMPELHTPTLDRLQREGLTFERFFCASPVCSPARASLATGRMPSAHGVHDWIRPEALARTGSPAPPFDPDFLERASGADSIAAMLSREGYRCGMVGNWHVGSSDRPAPGFDYWWAHQLGGGPYHGAPIWRFDEETGTPVQPAEPTEEPGYLTDAITRQGLDFLRRVGEEEDPATVFLPARRGGPARRARRLLRRDQRRGPQHRRAPGRARGPRSARGHDRRLHLRQRVLLRAPRDLGEGERDLPAELLGAVDHGAVHRALARPGPGRSGGRAPCLRRRPVPHARRAHRRHPARGPSARRALAGPAPAPRRDRGTERVGRRRGRGGTGRDP